MIVKMKEVTLLCLERNRSEALEALRDLGVMHVKQLGRVESDDVAELTRKITDAVKVYNILSGRKVSGESGENIAPERLVSEALELLDEEASVTKQRENLLKEMEKLAPWGNFEPETVRKLRESGVHVYLCSSFKSDFPKLSFPADAAVKVINRGRNDVYYMVVSQAPVDPVELQTVQLPDISLVKLQDLVRKGDDRLSDISRQLDVLALSCKCLRGYKESMEKDLEFAQNRDGMTGEGEIAYLQGYVPVTEVEKLRAEALKQGWALKIDDPAEDDMKVPTCIKKPKWMRIIDPLFDFIGIAPGYRENDVSLFFLIAFPIFFGMLIGDFAYGVLFMTTAFLCKYLFRKKEAAQMPLNLLILLSAFSIIFGLLQGACLGLPREILPAPLKGLDFLADPKNSPSACKLAEKLKIADPMDLKDKFHSGSAFCLPHASFLGARVQDDYRDTELAELGQSRLGIPDLGQLLHRGEPDCVSRHVPAVFCGDAVWRGNPADRCDDYGGGGVEPAVFDHRKFRGRAFLYPSVCCGALRRICRHLLQRHGAHGDGFPAAATAGDRSRGIDSCGGLRARPEHPAGHHGRDGSCNPVEYAGVFQSY